MLGSTIVRLAECFGEFLVGPDPGGQAVECRFLTDVGSIGLCQLAFVIGSYSVFHLMSYELSYASLQVVAFLYVKILKISDINNIKCHEVSSDFTLAARMSYFPFRGVVSLFCHPEDKRKITHNL